MGCTLNKTYGVVNINVRKSKKFRWKYVELIKTQDFKIDDKSGIYVVKHVERVMGLPLVDKIIYVGQTKNLKRRFREHCSPRSEHNLGLMHASAEEELEFWFTFVSKDELDVTERTLIAELDPLTNIQRFEP